jgi:hypothetical protein
MDLEWGDRESILGVRIGHGETLHPGQRWEDGGRSVFDRSGKKKGLQSISVTTRALHCFPLALYYAAMSMCDR